MSSVASTRRFMEENSYTLCGPPNRKKGKHPVVAREDKRRAAIIGYRVRDMNSLSDRACGFTPAASGMAMRYDDAFFVFTRKIKV